MDINEVEVNKVIYIRKDLIPTTPALPKTPMLIVRTKSAGVHYGWGTLDKATATIELTNSRRMWQWSGANCLSQLATTGTRNPADCRFSVAVPLVTLLEVIEVIPCTQEAQENLCKVAVWLKK